MVLQSLRVSFTASVPPQATHPHNLDLVRYGSDPAHLQNSLAQRLALPMGSDVAEERHEALADRDRQPLPCRCPVPIRGRI